MAPDQPAQSAFDPMMKRGAALGIAFFMGIAPALDSAKSGGHSSDLADGLGHVAHFLSASSSSSGDILAADHDGKPLWNNVQQYVVSRPLVSFDVDLTNPSFRHILSVESTAVSI